MKKVGILLVVLMIAVLGVMAVYQQRSAPKEDGVAVLQPVPVKLFTPLADSAGSYAIARQEKPADWADLPGDITETDRLFYFDLPVGQHTVAALTRVQGRDNIGLWIDTNLDRRLSDETMLRGVAGRHRYSSSNTDRYIEYAPVRLDGPDFTSVPFRLICDETGSYIRVKPLECYRGKIKLDGKVHAIAAIDNDFDGLFQTCFQPSSDANTPCCDMIALDSNQNDWFFKDGIERHEIIPMGLYLKPPSQTDTYYTIAFSDDGRRLQLESADPPMGTLKIGDNKQLRVQLYSDAATQQVDFKNEVRIPAGHYQLQYGWLTVVGKDGRDYQLSPSFLNTSRSGRFTVEAGQTVTLNPGPPFTVKTDLRYYGDDRISINADLVGREGEIYGLRLPTASDRPVIRILDDKNTEIHTGKMEYG